MYSSFHKAFINCSRIKSMKLLQLHSIMKTLNGSERVVIEYTKELVSENIDVCISSLSIAPECKKEIDKKVKLSELGVKLKKIDGFFPTLVQYFLCILLGFKKEKYDILLIHSYPCLIPSLIYKKIFNKKVKIIYYCQEPPRFAYDLYDLHKKELRGIKKILFITFVPIIRKVDSYCVKKMDHILVNSEFSKKSIRMAYPKEELNIVYLGVDTHKFTSNKNRTNRKIPYMISVGKLHKRKNFDFQIKALKEIIKKKKVVLRIVGAGPELENLKKISKDYEVENYVNFLGFVNEKELPELYRSSDIFIFSAKNEPFGLVVIEAMASGLPVVVPNEGGPAESCIDNKTGFIYKQNDYKDFSNKVINLLKDQKLKRKFSKNCMSRAKEFSWNKSYKRLKTFLK